MSLLNPQTIMTPLATRQVNPDELRVHFLEHMESPASHCRLCGTGKAKRLRAGTPPIDFERERQRARLADELLRELAETNDD